ncbi:MAG: hypothetical protein ICV72_04755 [Aldersonia sp.]|nr:hypothetical protein [Aldersonia sp.]
MTIALCRILVTRVLIGVIVVLTLASFVARVLRYEVGESGHWHLLRIVDAGAEGSVPTWWSSATLLACALLLAVIARVDRLNGGAYARWWAALAVLLLAASVDEVAQVHEAVGSFFWWVLPGLAVAMIVAVLSVGFVRSLTRPVRRRVVAAGVVFVVGALGFESASAAVIAASGVSDWDQARGTAKIVVGVLTSFEEFSEMLGVVFLLDALMLHLATYTAGVAIRVADGDPAGEPVAHADVPGDNPTDRLDAIDDRLSEVEALLARALVGLEAGDAARVDDGGERRRGGNVGVRRDRH